MELHGKIRAGARVCGRVTTGHSGGGSGRYQAKTVEPNLSQQLVLPDAGYDALSSVTVQPAAAGENDITWRYNSTTRQLTIYADATEEPG